MEFSGQKMGKQQVQAYSNILESKQALAYSTLILESILTYYTLNQSLDSLIAYQVEKIGGFGLH
jgi:hypothetical protein